MKNNPDENTSFQPLVAQDESMPLTVTIDVADNGFICNVGCKTFVFGSLSVLMDNLHAYLEKPQEVMQSYLKNGSLPVNK